MKITKDIILRALFYGAIWGILEASLGFILHLALPLGVGTGAIMFGFAAVIMKKASEHDTKVSLLVPIIAASIKLTNLIFVMLVPNYTTTMVLKVVNPALAIILEGLALVVAFKFMYKSNLANGMSSIIGASFAWHIIYVIYHFGLFNMGIKTPYFKAGFDIMNSIVGPGLFGGFISFAIFYVINLSNLKNMNFQFKPVYSYATSALAIMLTIIL